MANVKPLFMGELIQDFQKALVSLDKIKADALFQQALLSHSPIEVVEQFVVPALEQIGRQWNEGSIALSQIYMSGRFCEKLVEQVLPPCDPDRKHQPRQAIVVLNDYHMLGMRIIFSVMRASGFELFNYGRMDVVELVERVIADKLKILLISVLMLPSALKVRELRTVLDTRGINVKILVGGAPFQFDPSLWQEIGADAMGRSAADAVTIVQRWAGEME
ncbi:MAG: cobalamin-dependent protein [Methylococcales bacterium]|nr:cobalamin-dependent protein [Methylococcales bacterium]